MCLQFYNAFKGDPKRSNIPGPIKAEKNACFIPTTQKKAWINKQTKHPFQFQNTVFSWHWTPKQFNQKQISILHFIFNFCLSVIL